MHRVLFLLLAGLVASVSAHAKDRPVTFCLEDGEGGHAKRGMVLVWSDELEIVRDAENAFKIGSDGCVEISQLRWNNVDFTLTAWVSLNYEARAPGFYHSPGSVRISKKKKRNTKVLMMERKQP